MTLVFFDGFENGTGKPEWNGTAPVASGGRGSNYMMGGDGAILTLPAAQAKTTVGFALYANTATMYVTLRGDAGATSHVSVTWVPGAVVYLRLGAYNSATILASSSVTIPQAEWHHMQIQGTIADSGGRIIVKLDGVTIIDYTGDTKNGGTNTTVDRVAFGTTGASSASNYRFDDVWVCDGVDATSTQGRANNDFLGDLKAVMLYPAAAGDVTQWTPSSAVANYTTVDETAANTTDYIGSTTVGQQDLYQLTDLPAGAVTVYGVQASVYGANSDAGFGRVKTMIKELTGTISQSAVLPLSTSWAGYFGPLRTTKAGGSSPFTVSDVNGLQGGVEAA